MYVWLGHKRTENRSNGPCAKEDEVRDKRVPHHGRAGLAGRQQHAHRDMPRNTQGLVRELAKREDKVKATAEIRGDGGNGAVPDPNELHENRRGIVADIACPRRRSLG